MDNTKQYRIVTDYGYGDKHWFKRFLTAQQVKEYFMDNGWTSEDFDEVGIEYFMDNDFIHYVEIDHENDVEDWDWQDS